MNGGLGLEYLGGEGVIIMGVLVVIIVGINHRRCYCCSAFRVVGIRAGRMVQRPQLKNAAGKNDEVWGRDGIMGGCWGKEWDHGS